MKKSKAQRQAAKELHKFIDHICDPNAALDELTIRSLMRKIQTVRRLNVTETPVDMFAAVPAREFKAHAQPLLTQKVLL